MDSNLALFSHHWWVSPWCFGKMWFSTWERLKQSIALCVCFIWLWSLLSKWLLTHFAASEGGSLLPQAKLHHSSHVFSQLGKKQTAKVTAKSFLELVPNKTRTNWTANAWGYDTPNWHNDESRLWCRLALPMSGPKSCIWTHRKGYRQLARMFCTGVRWNNSLNQQLAVIFCHNSKRKAKLGDVQYKLLAYHFE